MNEGNRTFAKSRSLKKAQPTFLVMTPNWTLHRWHSSASTQSGAWTKQTSVRYYLPTAASLSGKSFSRPISSVEMASIQHFGVYSTQSKSLTTQQWNKKHKMSYSLCCKHRITLLKLREHMTCKKISGKHAC